MNVDTHTSPTSAIDRSSKSKVKVVVSLADRCDLCGSDLEGNYLCLAQGEIAVGSFSCAVSTIMCKNCKFIFQREIFNDELLAQLYAQDRGFTTNETTDNTELVNHHRQLRQTFIKKALVKRSGQKILDIGGGAGECTENLCADNQITVVDANGDPPRDSRIKKRVGLFQAMSFSEQFDVIIMNHILEHVFSPSNFLLLAHRVLAVGGVLIVEVPFELYTPLIARRIGDWRHVAYFSRATLRQYLIKTGFAVTHLVLEEGCYGARRLPVIRAVARKVEKVIPDHAICNTALTLAADMLAPAALVSIGKSKLTRR